VVHAEENAIVGRARQLIAVYEDMAELIRLGAYRRGTDPQVEVVDLFAPADETFKDPGGKDFLGLGEGLKKRIMAVDVEVDEGGRHRCP